MSIYFFWNKKASSRSFCFFGRKMSMWAETRDESSYAWVPVKEGPPPVKMKMCRRRARGQLNFISPGYLVIPAKEKNP